MKTKMIVILAIVALLLSACGGEAGSSEDQQLVFAQQTLDVLNASVGQVTAVVTAEPQSDNNMNSADTGGNSGANDDFAAAVGQWASLDVDNSYQTLTISSTDGGSYTFTYTDQMSTFCGSGADIAMTFSGTGTATNNVLTASQVPGVCEVGGQSIKTNLQYTYQPGSNMIIDNAGVVWIPANGKIAKTYVGPTGDRINFLMHPMAQLNFQRVRHFILDKVGVWMMENPLLMSLLQRDLNSC